MNRPLVYLAGPFTAPDPLINTALAVDWAERVEGVGCDVFIPHTHSFMWHYQRPASHDRWMDRDFALLARCDAMFRYSDDHSVGADMECRFADAHDIPVFMSLTVLGTWARHWRLDHAG